MTPQGCGVVFVRGRELRWGWSNDRFLRKVDRFYAKVDRFLKVLDRLSCSEGIKI